MDRKKLLQCILAAALAVGACGDDGDDPGPSGGSDAGGSGGSDAGGPGADAGGAPSACGGFTYAKDIQPLFKQECLVCHDTKNAPNLGAMVVMDTLAGVIAQKEHIIEHAVKLEEPKMPLGTSGLPKAQRDMIEKWLNCGAPP